MVTVGKNIRNSNELNNIENQIPLTPSSIPEGLGIRTGGRFEKLL
jgi:hypothetical protein